MVFVRKDKECSGRSFLSYVNIKLKTIVSGPHRRPIKYWLCGIVLVVLATVFLLGQNTNHAGAAPQSDPLLECSSCHTKILVGHDKLGPGDEACLVCHDTSGMAALHPAGGVSLIPEDSPQLCGQCHQKRYKAWQEGTHGIPGPSTEKCTDCHEPHQPQLAFVNITRPHTENKLFIPPPPVELLQVVGVSLLLLVIAGVVVARRG